MKLTVPINVKMDMDEIIERLKKDDFVQVVRCKDCKHNSLNRLSGNAFCDLGIGLSQIYDFCSLGERREDVSNC